MRTSRSPFTHAFLTLLIGCGAMPGEVDDHPMTSQELAPLAIECVAPLRDRPETKIRFRPYCSKGTGSYSCTLPNMVMPNMTCVTDLSSCSEPKVDWFTQHGGNLIRPTVVYQRPKHCSADSVGTRIQAGGGGWVEMCDCRFKHTKDGIAVYDCTTPKDNGYGHICVWDMKCPEDKQMGNWAPHPVTAEKVLKNEFFGCFGTAFAFLGDPFPPFFFGP